MGRESDLPSRSDSTELAEVLRREGFMGLMRLWGAIRALTQINTFEDEDEDEDEASTIIRLKIEQSRLGVRFVAFCFASRRFGLG
jgi:hypothetical protein